MGAYTPSTPLFARRTSSGMQPTDNIALARWFSASRDAALAYASPTRHADDVDAPTSSPSIESRSRLSIAVARATPAVRATITVAASPPRVAVAVAVARRAVIQPRGWLVHHRA
eukprot:CAMPEP_0179686086 /NCGR_PEP_ID=MMETSP0936-20121108/1435_1 /TAXON_ID=548131 ORGANISM="Ostreococcus mediterraneus, Strain clade-D-RCC2573" /NCGR_SAMPLE_ID=MMETSP0936 /ASSEMBLY_ACC=CAM_ASM_000574 /LENGTH=113 /DNA_ID=CAMNT_0021558523 /DNA_START=300 /DNA_END=639 /DNA_ORIENTATION=+